MNDKAEGTLFRAEKGPLAPAPVLVGALKAVADEVASWAGIQATVHWHLFNRSQVDGVDFYCGEEELGHLHLDGMIHLATNRRLGATLIAEGTARPFRYQPGWVEAQSNDIGVRAAVALFRRNYDCLLGHRP